MVIWVALLTLVFDQLTKYLVRLSLCQGQSVVFIPHFLYLTYIKNTGISFGLLKGKIPLSFYLVLSLLAISMLAIFLRGAKRGLTERLTTGLIGGGILGNLIDRIRFGAVIDFLDFGIIPIFNLADSAITIGVIILLISEIREARTYRTKRI